MAATARAVRTIDPDPWVHQTIWPTLPNLVTHAALLNPGNSGVFDVAFIDADHTSEAVEADVRYARTMLREPGLIVCHDANYDNVKQGLARAGGTWVTINTTHGLALQWV
jgi:hypothetical protein